MDEEEKTKEQIKKLAAKGNVFAKGMLDHYKNNDNNKKKDGDFFEIIFGFPGVLLVIFVFGVVIFAVIKWAFKIVF